MSCFLCVEEFDGECHKNQEISIEESAYLCSFLGLPNNDEDYKKNFHKFCHVCDSCKNKIVEAKSFMQKLEQLELEIRVLRDEFYDSLKQGYFHKLTTSSHDDFSYSFREKIVQALQLVINIAPENTVLIYDEEFPYQIVEVCESTMNDDGGFQLSNDDDDQVTDLNKGDEEYKNQEDLIKFPPPTSSLSTSLNSKNQSIYFNSNNRSTKTISNTIPSSSSTSSLLTLPIKEEDNNLVQETKFTLVDNDVEIQRRKHEITNDVSIVVERLTTESIIRICEQRGKRSNRSKLCQKSQTRIKGRLRCLFPNCIVTFTNEIIRRAHIRKFHADHNKIGSLQKKRKPMKHSSTSVYNPSDDDDDKKNNDDPDFVIKTSKPFSCTFEECSAKFCAEARLESHLRRVHGQGSVGEMVCHVCNKSGFSTRRQFNNHLMYHRPKKYNCNVCKKGFVRAPDLRKHEKSHGPRKRFSSQPVPSDSGIVPETSTESRIPRPKIICPHEGCGAVYHEKYRLDVHTRKVHLGLENPYKCRFPDCPAEMKNRPSYDEHIQTIHSIKPKVWKCKICPDYIEFNVRKLYDEHMEENHPEAERKGNWSCPYCHEKFRTLDLRLIHMRLNHADQKNPFTRGKQSDGSSDQEIHVCHVCGIKKVGKKKLKDHLKYHGKKHSCPFCPNKTFSRLADLKRHTLTHSEERNATCDRCGKSFKDPGYLRVHHRTCSIGDRKKFPCTVEGCASIYSNESSLRVHLREHDGSLQRTHKCDLCEFKAKWASTIMYHRRTHFSTKDFACNLCTAKFKQKNSLTLHIDFKHLGKRGKHCTFAGCTYKAADKQSLDDHMRTHTKEKPFVCTTCSRPFSKKCHLYRHERTQHQQAIEGQKKPGRPRKEFLSRICIEEQPDAQEQKVAEYLIYELKC